MKNIYYLKLHESTREDMQIDGETVAPLWITRVPGGWIYYDKDSAVFVPHNNEFHPPRDILEKPREERGELK